MAKTTLADLVLNAQASANKAFQLESPIARLKTKTQEFEAAAFHEDDFTTWENAFNAQLDMLTHFSQLDSPATEAAKKAAAIAA